MLSLGPLAFLSPWLLLALMALPLIWWLIRITPPAPRRQLFPAIRLLFGLKPPEETPARTPPWLLLLRLFLAALVILALAGPLLNPMRPLAGGGPLLLLLDDGWASAAGWEKRRGLAEALLGQAERDRRPVMLLTSAPDAATTAEQPPELADVTAVRERVEGLQPKPWPLDRATLLARLSGVAFAQAAEVVWLSDGLAGGPVEALAARLNELGTVTLYAEAQEDLPRLLLPPEGEGRQLLLAARRADSGAAEALHLRAYDDEGRLLAESEIAFAAGAAEGKAALELPVELRNRIARLAIAGEAGAGATLLMDERWRRRPVGLVSGGPQERLQPLLSDLYYLERALDPFTELRRAPLAELLDQELAVIALADVGHLPAEEEAGLTAWVERGGLLLRFAGPRLAESEEGDGLLPVRLRRGGRNLGGALTWDRPARLASFPEDGPFAGLVPSAEVSIARQVLAEPSLELAEKTWARLSDGTPLITAERRGEGTLVLVHTTANADWSNLPLSGLYVELLRRIVGVSQGVVGGAGDAALPPLAVLDGFGRLTAPPPSVLALDRATIEAGAVGPTHPPGFYGADDARRAFNLIEARPELAPLPNLSSSILRAAYATGEELRLGPWLLAAALLIALADLLISLALRGQLLPAHRGGAPAAFLLLLLYGLAAPPAEAQQAPRSSVAPRAALETQLAYVATGVPSVDEASRSGLTGLSRMLALRTAVEPAEPQAVRPGRDELAFYPLLYWPIAPEQRDLDSAAVEALDDYLRNGGTILIDLREPSSGARLFGQASRGSDALARLTRGLEVPPLVPIPPEHVLTKSFYLLQDFPGRLAGGTLWVEESDETDHDGVSSLIVGSNDWASAWAIDEAGRPLLPVVPGGERQREMAFRFGVNLVMYALTGNYKADQVHVPFILERLGQ